MINNDVKIVGELVSPSVYTHRYLDKDYYLSKIRVKRKSETYDTIPVVSTVMLKETGMKYRITGRYRSRNHIDTDGKRRLVLEVVANTVELVNSDEYFENCIQLTGYIVKKPEFRITPFRREICDVMIAVHTGRKSSYIPLIVWGEDARYASKLKIGEIISVTGRIQSRIYKKIEEDGTEHERIAYEVSAYNIRKVEGNEELQGWDVTLFNYNLL